MQPGSTIGDAEPMIGTERAGEKILSAWKEELAAAAGPDVTDELGLLALAGEDPVDRAIAVGYAEVRGTVHLVDIGDLARLPAVAYVQEHVVRLAHMGR